MEEKEIIRGVFSPKNVLAIVFGALAIIFFILGGTLDSSTCYVIGVALTAITIYFLLVMNLCKLTLTDKRIYGSIKFGNRVDLPLNQISSIGQGWFESLIVATSSGAVRFWLLENRAEVFSELSKLLSDFQGKSNAPETVVKQEASTADELKKFKDLLDSGVITQEEFDAKKKQLLGL